MIPLAVGSRIGTGCSIFQKTDIKLFVFAAVSYVAWSVMFSYHRYAIPLELLAGLVIVLVLYRLLQPTSAAVVAVLLATAIGLWSVPANWGRRSWSQPYAVDTSSLTVKTPSIFFMLNVPTSYIVRHLPTGSRFFSIATRHHLPLPAGGRLDARIREALKTAAPEMLWALKKQGPADYVDGLALYGLALNSGQQCQGIYGALATNLEVCPLIRTSP